MSHQLNCIPVAQKTCWILHGPKIHAENSVVRWGDIMVWGYTQFGDVREIRRVDGNINGLKYQEVLAAHYI